MFVVVVTCKFMSKVKENHGEDVKKRSIISVVRGTKIQVVIVGFLDSSYVGCMTKEYLH